MANRPHETQNSLEENLGQVMSLCWEKGKIAASYYDLSSLELFTCHEALDHSPEFAMTMNLLRQVKPLHILASGPNYFLRELLVYCHLPRDEDLGRYKVKSLRMAALLPLIIFPQSEKSLSANRRIILELNLPGMPGQLVAADRTAYVESMLPLHQHLVVHSLGALLQYIHANKSHLFLGLGSDVVVSDLKVYKLQTEVPMDDVTMGSLQIFSGTNHHPSGYKEGENQSVEGFSIFRLVDRCFSRLGSKSMKMILSHPIREPEKLNSRYNTISWYLSAKNSDKLQPIKKYLKNVGDISQVFRNIVLQPENIKNWHLFKKIVYNGYMVLKSCQEIGTTAAPNTLFPEVAEFIEDDNYILQVLHVLDRVVDLDEELSHSKFSVKMGLDVDLDEKKKLMISIQNSIQEGVQNELKELSSCVGDISSYYIPEVGYVIKVVFYGEQSLVAEQLNQNFTLVSRSDEAHYYQNNHCKELNEKYGKLYSEIREHESRICQRLVSFLKERLLGIQGVVKLCAQLDCILSFAQVADEMSLRKPEILPKKTLNIQQGRHILWALRQRMVPNDFISGESNRKLVTLLSAPNSSGKSVYLKQVALTAYLAHVGSFVPTSATRLGLLDSIYSRINCPESVYGNNSSFLTDVRQLGKVMTNSSDRSLILIDEFGKGTSLLEAQALLASCIENLVKRGEKCPITLISTHYADIYDIVPDKDKDAISIKTFENITTKNGEMISTFQLKEGRTVRNYATKIVGVKQFMEEINKRCTDGGNNLANIKVRLAVFMIWLRLHGQIIDYQKLMDRVCVHLLR